MPLLKVIPATKDRYFVSVRDQQVLVFGGWAAVATRIPETVLRGLRTSHVLLRTALHTMLAIGDWAAVLRIYELHDGYRLVVADAQLFDEFAHAEVPELELNIGY